jgi:hypothetical protein
MWQQIQEHHFLRIKKTTPNDAEWGEGEALGCRGVGWGGIGGDIGV